MNKYLIKELMNVNRGSSPRPIIEYLSDSGYRWLKISDFNMYDRYVYETKEFIKESGLKNTRHLPAGTLILTNSATPGIPIFLGRDMCLHDGFLYFTNIKEDIININFLYYWFLYNRDLIVNQANGSVFKNLKKEIVENFEINIPNMDTQLKIVEVLDNINSKIELNNKINNNLQELAKSIYYEKFKDKGNNGKLKDILDLHRKSVKNKDESLKYFPVDVLPMNYLITKDGKPNEEAQSSLVEFKKYDILVGAMRVYFHRVCLATENGITRTTTFVLRPKDNNYLYYSLITLDKDDFIKYANDGSKGSTMPYAVWDNNCNEYEIYVPTASEAKEFNDIVKPLFEIQIINEKNNRYLEKLRDTFLPKLMNGEIDLDNIEI